MNNETVETSLLEENLEDLYEEAPCGYLSILDDGSIIKVNGTFTRWLDYSQKELLDNVKFKSLLSPGSRIFYETHFAPLLKMQSYISEINLELLSKAGKRIPVLVSSVLKKGEKHSIARITVFNISDRKKYEQDLLFERKRAEKEAQSKANFLSMMSHEIRTPMNAVVGISDLLARTKLSSEQKKYVDVLSKSSNNLLNLLNNILDYGRIDSGKVTLQHQHFSLEKLAADIVDPLAVIANNKGIGLELEVADDVPDSLEGDSIKIAQILSNLVGNSIKFTESGLVKLKISKTALTRSHVSLLFEVIDSGIGIEADSLNCIFEEFSQANDDTARLYGGTGLGLSISKKLIELLGGKIQVQSQIGEGSIFSFCIDLKVADKTLSSADCEKDILKSKALSGLHLLVAEDSEENLFILEVLLKSWGVTFDPAPNGLIALELLKMNSYDMVFLDLQMPQMNGYEAASEIRKTYGGSLKKIPIIAFSASSKIGSENLDEFSGFDDFISKPFRSEELFKKIAQWSGRSLK